MEKYVVIQLKDICWYDDSFVYEPFIVKKTEDFEEKYKKLEEICKNYNDFQEVEDFISDNFEKLDFEFKLIHI